MEETAKRHLIPFIMAAACLVFFRQDYALSSGCGTADRLCYSFTHQNIFHMAANLYALFIIEQSQFRTPWKVWLVSYAIAVACLPSTAPAMGLSGVIYACLGIISWQALERWKFHGLCLICLAVGLLFPNQVANLVHFWCYGVGIVVGLIMWRWRHRLRTY